MTSWIVGDGFPNWWIAVMLVWKVASAEDYSDASLFSSTCHRPDSRAEE